MKNASKRTRKPVIALSVQPLAAALLNALLTGENVTPDVKERLAGLDERQKNQVAQSATALLFADRAKHLGQLTKTLDKMLGDKKKGAK